MKKQHIIAWLLVCALVLSAPLSAFAFTDMPQPTHWSFGAMAYAVSNKVLQGFEDDTIRPNDSLTRAQAATILVRIFEGTETVKYTGFTDVKEDAWFYDAVTKAVKRGYFKGKTETNFSPDDKISRQEVFTVVARAMELSATEETLPFADADTVAAWAKDAIMALYQKEYIKGADGNMILPQKEISRAEFAQTLYNIFGKKTEDIGGGNTGGGNTGGGNTGGGNTGGGNTGGGNTGGGNTGGGNTGGGNTGGGNTGGGNTGGNTGENASVDTDFGGNDFYGEDIFDD